MEKFFGPDFNATTSLITDAAKVQNTVLQPAFLPKSKKKHSSYYYNSSYNNTVQSPQSSLLQVAVMQQALAAAGQGSPGNNSGMPLPGSLPTVPQYLQQQPMFLQLLFTTHVTVPPPRQRQRQRPRTQGQEKMPELPHVSTPLPDIPVGGHLRYFLPQWTQITSDPSILEMITGMNIDLVDFPRQRNIFNPLKFSPEETSATDKLITELINKCAIEQCKRKPGDYVSTIFLWQEPNGSYQMILNLKTITGMSITNIFKWIHCYKFCV